MKERGRAIEVSIKMFIVLALIEIQFESIENRVQHKTIKN